MSLTNTILLAKTVMVAGGHPEVPLLNTPVPHRMRVKYADTATHQTSNHSLVREGLVKSRWSLCEKMVCMWICENTDPPSPPLLLGNSKRNRSKLV